MLSQPVRFSRLRTTVFLFSMIAILAAAGLVACGVVIFVREGWREFAWIPMITSGIGIVAGAVAILAFTLLLVKIESHSHRQYNQMIDLCDLVTRQSTVLGSIAQNLRISDIAKAITSREQDRDAVRIAIREEMARQDWEAALYLVEQMEQRFGYKDEAEELRREVVEARTADMRDRLNEALERIESLWAAHDWDRAEREIERLMRALPDDKRTVRLRREQQKRRDAYKQALLAAWNDAVSHTGLEGDMDVDRAIEILKELDLYLTREEARSVEESARGVFKAKLARLGIQFEYAVKDHRWRDAIEIGVQIKDEFPNSRMAREVQEMESGLRQRAGMSGDVEVIAGPQPRK